MTKECKIDGCSNKVRARGWCHNHYQRWLRNGDPTASGWSVMRTRKPRTKATTEKRCARCGETKPADEFYTVERPYGTYLSAYCKPCHSEYHAIKWAEYMAERGPMPRKRHDEPCEFEGCDKTAKTRFQGSGQWLCSGHDQQRRDGRELTPLRDNMPSYINDRVRKCTGCEKIKGVHDFYFRPNGTSHSRCKECAILASNFMQAIRNGNLDLALGIAGRMPERLKNKYMDKLATQLNGSELER